MNDQKFWELIDRDRKLVQSRKKAMEGKDTERLAILRAKERAISEILNGDAGRPELMDKHKEIMAEIVAIEDSILGQEFCEEYYREKASIQNGWDEYLAEIGPEGKR